MWWLEGLDPLVVGSDVVDGRSISGEVRVVSFACLGIAVAPADVPIITTFPPRGCCLEKEKKKEW